MTNPKTSGEFELLKKEVARLKTLSSSELMMYWSAHQKGRGASGLGFRSRTLVNDLANIAANFAAAKGTKGDRKKMYTKIAHDIYMDAKKTARKKNPTKGKHANHDWYVDSMARASKVGDHGLLQNLKSDLQRMTKKHRDNIMHDYRAAYKAQYESQRGMRKMTTKNPDRITQAWLDKRVDLLNDMLGRPKTQYTKKAGGGLIGNGGHLFIDHAYGGVKVAEMSGGGTGENNISDGYVPKRELNNFINGMIAAARLAERKTNPITEGQLENFVYELDSSGRDELKGALAFAVMYSKDYSQSPAQRIIYKDMAKLIRKEIKKFAPSRNPKGRKKMAKKKRSAKQLANDKRLGRMAKARAKTKRGGARKKKSKINCGACTVAIGAHTYGKGCRKKKATRNPKRKVSARSHLWNIFKCRGQSVMFLTYNVGGNPTWSKHRGKAIAFKSSDMAHRYAAGIANMRGYSKYQLGAVSQTNTAAQIRASCNAGK